MSKIFVFTDLDDTLFQTRRKCSTPMIKQATFATDNPSFMTTAQRCLLDLYLDHRDVDVIPITARNKAQYDRTFLAREPKITHAVLYYSGMILQNGAPDQAWSRAIQGKLDSLVPTVAAYMAELNNHAVVPELFELNMVDGYYIHIRHKHKTNYQQDVAALHAAITSVHSNYYIYQYDRSIVLLPAWLNKREAMQYLMDKYQPNLTIGMGDQLTDIGFMLNADFAMMPTNSQISQLIHDVTGV